MSKHHAMATTRCRHGRLYSSQPAHKVWAMLCWAPSLRGPGDPAAVARHMHLHFPRLLGLQDLLWKGSKALPGIESLLAYLEVQI